MLIPLLMLLLAAPLSQSQDEAQEKEKSKPPKRGEVVLAKGCLKGGMLESGTLGEPDGVDRFTLPLTYRLTGDKRTIETIRKEHDGHSDVITGELKTDLPASTENQGTRIGNTRITIGVGSSRGMMPEPPPPMPVLRVTSFEHTGVTCR